MSMNRVPGWASVTVRAPPEPRTAICDRPARWALAPTLGLSLEHPDEGVEVGVDRRAERAALWQLDVEDQPWRPELDR